MNRFNYSLKSICVWIILLKICAFYIPATGSTQELIASRDKLNSVDKIQTGINNVQELEIIADWFFKDRMKKLHIPGVVLVVVKSDSICYKKGYGYANLEKKVPIKPEETLFRIGSITKLFTTTAVMQLAERGLLKLNDNVNDHLKLFKIRNNYPNPIKIANLLTHSAGFDHQQIGKYTRYGSEIQPLGEYLREKMPRLLFNPGELISYSNYGISLAGYLVEEISEVPFTHYVKENIFNPLEMYQSRFNYPQQFDPDCATGYRFTNGIFKPVPKENLNLSPSGAIMTTAADMANFITAHLNDGSFQKARILNEATIKKMHKQQFTNHSQMPGWCYGFYESYENNRRAIFHSGNTRGFSSLLYLLPEQELGIFLSYNSNNPKLYNEFLELFLDRFYPSFDKSIQNLNPTYSQSRYNKFVGIYQFNHFPKFTVAKLSNLFDNSSEVRVTSNDDGTIKISLPEKTMQIFEVRPLLFKIMHEEGFVAFKENENGNISHMFVNLEKPITLKKLSWWETFRFQYNFLKVFYLIFISSIGIFLIYYFKTKKTFQFSTLLAIAVCTINLMFLFGLENFYNSSEFRLGINSGFSVLLGLPIISVFLSVVLPFFAILTWKNKQGTILERVHYSLISIAALSFIPFLDFWNLIGFKF